MNKSYVSEKIERRHLEQENIKKFTKRTVKGALFYLSIEYIPSI